MIDMTKKEIRDLKNGEAVKSLFRLMSGDKVGKISVNSEDLKKIGWEGPMPTLVFKRYGDVWIKKLSGNEFQIVRVTDEMTNKKEPDREEYKDAPLPIDLNKNRIDIRKLAGKTGSAAATEQAVNQQLKDKK